MKKLFREPLVHFLLLGTALFAASGLVSRGGGGKERIVVSAGQIEHLAASFQRTWLRPPTQPELDGLIRDYIREEVASREALALGLDRDDTVIRRRLRQKVEFISEELARAEPTEEELRTYFTQNAGAFRVEERFTFSQVYLDPERRGDALAGEVKRLLADLARSGADAEIDQLGDATLLEPYFRLASAADVSDSFGREFVAQLALLAPGEWHGPISSTYGVHLVFVHERDEGRAVPFDDVREAVRREWENARRTSASDTFYERLLARYTVTVEPRALPGAPSALAAEEP